MKDFCFAESWFCRHTQLIWQHRSFSMCVSEHFVLYLHGRLSLFPDLKFYSWDRLFCWVKFWIALWSEMAELNIGHKAQVVWLVTVPAAAEGGGVTLLCGGGDKSVELGVTVSTSRHARPVKPAQLLHCTQYLVNKHFNYIPHKGLAQQISCQAWKGMCSKKAANEKRGTCPSWMNRIRECLLSEGRQKRGGQVYTASESIAWTCTNVWACMDFAISSQILGGGGQTRNVPKCQNRPVFRVRGINHHQNERFGYLFESKCHKSHCFQRKIKKIHERERELIGRTVCLTTPRNLAGRG